MMLHNKVKVILDYLEVTQCNFQLFLVQMRCLLQSELQKLYQHEFFLVTDYGGQTLPLKLEDSFYI